MGQGVANLGLCLECGHSIPESRASLFCELCDADRAEEARKGRRRKVGEGRDPEYRKKRRAALGALGRCQNCGCRVALDRSYSLCEKCLDASKRRVAKRRARLLAAGKCQKCGQRESAPHARCAPCREAYNAKCRERRRLRRERQGPRKSMVA